MISVIKIVCILIGIKIIVNGVLEGINIIIDKKLLETENEILKRKLKEVQKHNQMEPYKFYNEEKQMMKKAMKKEMARIHPDNGGDEKIFCKYKELYEKLK